MKKYVLFFFVFLAIFMAHAQQYSDCYTNYMKNGQALFDQGKYSEAKTIFVLATKCQNGNPAVAREKIRLCEEKIRTQESEASEVDNQDFIITRDEQENGFDSEDINKAEPETETVSQDNSENKDVFADRHDGMPCPEQPTVTDYDGNVYNTVLIGIQCWTRENMRSQHYADGREIVQINQPTNDYSPYYALPHGDVSMWEKVGFFYSWDAAMDNSNSSKKNPSGVQGVCPNGWHVPSMAEWKQLTIYVSSQSQYRCYDDKKLIAKSLADTSGWKDPSSDNVCKIGQKQEENNKTGFSAYPSGLVLFRYDLGFGRVHTGKAVRVAYGLEAAYWCSTHMNSLASTYFYMVYDSEKATLPTTALGELKMSALSVRCVKD